MRRALVLVTLGLIGLVSARALSQAQRPVVQPMKIEKVKENLYYIRGPWNTVDNDALLHEPGDVAVRVTPEGLIVIDDKFAQHTEGILEQIKSISTLPIKYLLNTHSHADHAGGDENFIKLTEIIAHRNARANMVKNKQPGPARVVFDNELSVFLGGAEVRAVYLGRGHTNGDAVIYFPDLRAIHSGDLVIEGMPFIDYDNGGSGIEWVKTIDNILKIDFDTVIPGHGSLRTRQDVMTHKARLEKMNAKMAALIKSGTPREKAKADLKAYLKEIGWDNTVSTQGFLGRSLDKYYDEIAASLKP